MPLDTVSALSATMATRPSRYRSSTSASTAPTVTKAAEVLQSLLDRTLSILSTSSFITGGYPDIQALLKYTGQIHQYLTGQTPPNSAQDDFRHQHGFQVLLSVLRSFSGYYNPDKRNEREKKALFELLHSTLAVLSAAFRGHHGNRRYFHHRVEGGGWEALEQVIASIGLGVSDSDLWSNCQLFGKLLSFALDDQRMDELCQWIATDGVSDEKSDVATPSTIEPNALDSSVEWTKVQKHEAQEEAEKTDKTEKKDDAVNIAHMKKRLGAIVGPKTVLQNAEVMRAVIGFWESITRTRASDADLVSLLVLDTVSTILDTSFANLAALHETGILSRFVRLYFDPRSPLNDDERKRILPICRAMMCLGVNELADAQFLLSSTDPAASEFCLDMATQYSGPPFVQFDLSRCGYSSIELPNLGRTFPPVNAGYTFTCWLRVDAFDPQSHTTIFGVFDSTQTCFLLLYLERDTRNFILQTSVTSSRPSVRFRSVSFEEKKWYHLALVHRRAKARASLFVNGEFVEQVKAAYPASPPVMPAGGHDSFVSFGTGNRGKPSPVQAFLGTPKDLSAQVGPGLVFSKWSLASAHLFEETLSDDFLAVHYRLGPRYQANYQDSLGGFQTYTASARLALRNEIHVGNDGSSDILRAIRDKASSIVPETKILMSTLPRSTFRTDGVFLESLLFRSLSRVSAANLLSLTAKSGTAVAINGALPCINDALTRSQGVAVLAGDPVLATPFYFDDNLWRLAGFTPLALKLVERAVTADELLRSAELVFRCINSSWRNSDAMERDNGYAILGMLLRAKLGFGPATTTTPPSAMSTATTPTTTTGSAVVWESTGSSMTSTSTGWRATAVSGDRRAASLRLLQLVLSFVGYDHADPLESLLVNPLAYRILLIDFDTWRKSPTATQRLYYEQFNTFAVMSKFHQFNSRRLLRMRIIKRLLDAVKVETVSEEILPYFLKSFESLIRCNYSAEVHRALALYITYGLHPPHTPLPRTPRTAGGGRPTNLVVRTPRPPANSISSNSSEAAAAAAATAVGEIIKPLTKRRMSVEILQLYERQLCEKNAVANIRKFARTVTNRWLLYLLSSDEAAVVVSGIRVLSRLLVTQGAGYTSKFGSKTGGFWIMAHRLKAWWHIPAVWVCVLGVFLGKDVSGHEAEERSFDAKALMGVFEPIIKVVYPDALVTVVAMLQQGLNGVLKLDEPTASLSAAVASTTPSTAELEKKDAPLEAVIQFLSMLHRQSSEFRDFALSSDYVRLLLSALFPSIVGMEALPAEMELSAKDAPLRFDAGEVHRRPSTAATTAATPVPVATATGATSVSSSLASSVHSSIGGSALDFAADSTVLGLAAGKAAAAAVVTGAAISSSPSPSRARRSSSFILLTTQAAPPSWNVARLAAHATPRHRLAVPEQPSNSRVQDGLLELVVDVMADQVLMRKEFPGFGLANKIPPSFQEHQIYFESYILRRAVRRIDRAVRRDMAMLGEPKVLTNMARFTVHMVDAILEGTFVDGVEPLMDFAGRLLDYLHRPDVAVLKSVRLCNQAVINIQTCFLKLVLFRLSDVGGGDGSDSEGENNDLETPTSPGGSRAAPPGLPVLERIFFWQSVFVDSLSLETSLDEYHLKLVLYQLYARLLDPDEAVRLAAASLWRLVLVQRPNETSTVLRQCATADQLHLARSLRQLTEADDGALLEWVDKHRPALDAFFLNGMSRFWEDFVATENNRAAEAGKTRLSRRRERLRQWQAEANERGSVLVRHEMANGAWLKSIYGTEHAKLQRLLQDQQDDLGYLATTFGKMERELRRPGAVFSEGGAPVRWRLDRTEGRNRMRLRLLPDASGGTEGMSRDKALEGAAAKEKPRGNTGGSTAGGSAAGGTGTGNAGTTTTTTGGGEGTTDAGGSAAFVPEDDFELVEGPGEETEEFEDKNRKVMRRLEAGDVVQSVSNVSRIIGLDACEGILIVGKEALYLVDNVFQRRDGEIVNAWQAPEDERDPFSQIIIGTQSKTPRNVDQESRSWRWPDVISVSKRRFLFRDVALELFFRDGRSYLLTTMDQAKRDEVFGRLMARTVSGPSGEDAWRLEALRTPEEGPATLGSKFGSIFNASAWNPAMRRWQRGELSNFHYLMLVNTMAGRTFNDLTQYPVFPWVLADYTSAELDLSDPKTFRDLSRPMGAQTTQRQADFDMRYRTLAEMGQPPFHYGTHYSSAMVVSSYLIRLPPFVQSFLLLQGGHFDHPDRLFSSIESAWRSASHDNGSDVRELIPEFFCLPEFLVNVNGYDFGRRQDGTRIDNVVLPPWAKGDPHIFIARHREALESPYVSQNLHRWIDLVFGHRQRGDAAVESLNVFHNLSYDGAIDLDNIQDPQERAVVTGIIHNFGQTPRQIFARPHPPRDAGAAVLLTNPPTASSLPRRLDTAVDALVRLPHPILESHERVASLLYVPKIDRLLCASPFRLNLPPFYDKYLEWGYADNSIRFFFSENRRPAGLFENLHIGQISCVAFADSRTLITAGEDCAVTVYSVQQAGAGGASATAPPATTTASSAASSSSAVSASATAPATPPPVDLLARSSLFGHKTPVTTVATSSAFSMLVTVSQDGVAMLWDLNRLEFIRKLPGARAVECACIHDVTGEILLCSGANMLLYSLNGELLVEQAVGDRDEDDRSCGGGGADAMRPPASPIHSCAFYEGAGNEWMARTLLFTGHRRGRVHVWRKAVGPRGRWVLEHVRRLDHVDPKSETGANVDAAITCITPLPHLVYTGDDDGRVWQWSLVQRDK